MIIELVTGWLENLSKHIIWKMIFSNPFLIYDSINFLIDSYDQLDHLFNPIFLVNHWSSLCMCLSYAGT
jgi:hypothetical protein